jgi:hypothetical protein
MLALGALACLLRYRLVESAEVARLCETAHALPCELRHLTVLGFITGNIFGWAIGVFGWVALAATAAAIAWKKLPLAWLAASTGLIAVVLYCFVPGALALLVGCLRLVRLQSAGATPGDEYRGAQGQVHRQP